MTQGPPTDRFIYFDIGQFAGQKDSCWNRRLKIPLVGITWDMIRQASADPKLALETRVPGTGKRGGPNCAKVKNLEWKAVRKILRWRAELPGQPRASEEGPALAPLREAQGADWSEAAWTATLDDMLAEPDQYQWKHSPTRPTEDGKPYSSFSALVF